MPALRIALASLLPAAWAATAGAAAPDETAWKRHVEEAEAAGKAGKTAEAVRHLERALPEAEAFGARDRRLAGTLAALGVAHNQAGEHAKAEPVLRRALRAIEAIEGPEHRSVAMALAPLGVSLRRQSRPKEAIDCYRRAVAILEKAGAGGSVEAVTLMEAWAEADESVGWLAEALGLVQRAVRTVEKAAGPEHPALVSLLERQASVLRGMRRPGDAEAAEAASARAAAVRAAAQEAARRDAAGPRWQGKTVRDWVAALSGPERMDALFALRQPDASALPLLVELLGHPASHVRMAAATGLAGLGAAAEPALSRLTGALGDRDLNVRYWSAQALAALGPAAAPAVPALAALLKTHPRTEPGLEGPARYYADARLIAALALGRIGPAAKAALPQLKQALKDEDAEVRKAAAEAVQKIEGK